MEANCYYRPELDALRFFAFLSVLIHHGPGAPGLAGIIRNTGGFGLSVFFLLSAYLITELLIREREQTGTIVWKFFFVRRALRIWPLYFAAIAVGIACVQMTRSVTLGMLLFIANWIPGDAGRWLAPLWSISIEEQFYLIWPPVVKAGGQVLAIAISVVLIVMAVTWLWVFSAKGWRLWYDTPVQFLFFAVGVLLAIATRHAPTAGLKTGDRIFLMAAGLVLLALAAGAGVGTADATGLSRTTLLTGYGGGAAGCAMVFRSVFGIQNIPRCLMYGGRISYGLYVMHSGMLQLAAWLISPLKLAHFTTTNMAVTDGVALLLSVIAAHFSYQHFEKPFLMLKQRFEIVKSRPV